MNSSNAFTKQAKGLMGLRPSFPAHDRPQLSRNAIIRLPETIFLLDVHDHLLRYTSIGNLL
jgi:hypothetical protein